MTGSLITQGLGTGRLVTQGYESVSPVPAGGGGSGGFPVPVHLLRPPRTLPGAVGATLPPPAWTSTPATLTPATVTHRGSATAVIGGVRTPGAAHQFTPALASHVGPARCELAGFAARGQDHQLDPAPLHAPAAAVVDDFVTHSEARFRSPRKQEEEDLLLLGLL